MARTTATTNGEDPSPNADALRFAVLRTNPDCNIAHFTIPQADFRSGNLERVEYVWNDWSSNSPASTSRPSPAAT